MRWRAVLKAIVGFLFRVLTKMEVEGLENIPVRGGTILAANHLSRLDAALIFALVKRNDVTGLVADKYKKYPFFRWLIEAVGGIWLNRESADFGALRQATDFLRGGGLLGIAPEGTRSRSGMLMAAKTGVAYVADKARVPILPVGIAGTESAVSQLLHLRRPRLQVRFGQPFTLPPLERGERSEGLRQNTDEIMCQIAALLPTAYRGAYADHPRLQEILSTAQFS